MAEQVEHEAATEAEDNEEAADSGVTPARIVRAERVLRGRTGRVMLVLDRIQNPHNGSAACRTAEALGIQRVWRVAPVLADAKRKQAPAKRPRRARREAARAVSKGADDWLSIRDFDTPGACAAALEAEGWDIWCAADGCGAIPLTGAFPPAAVAAARKVAVVIGREADGVDSAFLDRGRRVVAPMRGFTSSFNLNVAVALVVSRVFDWFPHFVGDLDASERAALREEWRDVIAKNDTARAKLQKWLDDPEAVVVPDPASAPAPEPGVSCGSWAPRKVQAAEALAAAEKVDAAATGPS